MKEIVFCVCVLLLLAVFLIIKNDSIDNFYIIEMNFYRCGVLYSDVVNCGYLPKLKSNEIYTDTDRYPIIFNKQLKKI